MIFLRKECRSDTHPINSIKYPLGNCSCKHLASILSLSELFRIRDISRMIKFDKGFIMLNGLFANFHTYNVEGLRHAELYKNYIGDNAY
uniref:Uncharacterized protein n=1 Tax=Romanomermis culicivorax TaxID=13658 RepID=A0A915HNE7_ROMCU